VGIYESGAYKKRAVIKKTVLCGDLRQSAVIHGYPRGDRRQYSLNNKWVQKVILKISGIKK
jgi:hypothetical protein